MEGESKDYKEETVYTVETGNDTFKITSGGGNVQLLQPDDGIEFNMDQRDARALGNALIDAANKG